MASTNADAFLSQLTGTWSLLAVLARNTATNDTIHPMGEAVQGTLVYTPDGYISSNVQASSLPNWAGGWNVPSQAEALHSVRATQAYQGPFYVEKTYPAIGDVQENDLGDGEKVFRRTVYHDIKTAQPPNWRGTLQKRLATMELAAEGRWYLTMRVEEEVDMGALAAGVEGKWRLEVRFVKAEVNEPGTGLPGDRKNFKLQ